MKNNAWLHDPVWFTPPDGSGQGLWKSSPSPPPAPDYQGAATATAAGNKENTIAAQQGSMVNQFTPYGSLSYSAGTPTKEGNPTYNANYTLTPEAQQTLDKQMGLSNQMADLTGRSMGAVNAQGPMDLNSVQKIQDQSYADQTARLDPQWKQNDQTQASTLANQGIMQGSEAYNNAMRTYGQSKNDAYTQARQAALATAPQTYQLAQATYDQPLNRANALRTGAQVQNPTFSAQPGQQYTPGPDLLGAAGLQNQYGMGVYNAGVGAANSANAGIAKLGAAGIMALSDRRLKIDIKRVGVLESGLPVYTYRYIMGGPVQLGVMADEAKEMFPEAVRSTDDGYLMVNYGELS